MNATTRNIVIAIIVILIIAALGYLAWQENQNGSMTGSTATSTVSTSTGSSIDLSSLTSATTTGGYTITPVTTGNAPTAPNYKTPLTFSSSISADEQAQDQSQFAADQTALASNSKEYSAWLDLGILREETGDYQGAAADWKYVTQLYPSDPTAFANLGDLYATYLKQPTQSIVYYKDAIKNDPTKEETFYQNLAQVYINEGDTADAKAILQQGISVQVVGYQNLQNELNSMQ